MTTEEKLNEFERAFNKIAETVERIVERTNLNKIKLVDRKIHLGIHKLNILGTEYFYSMYIIKTRNTNKLMYGKYKIAYDFLPYTIQTHKESGNKYIISFGDLKRKPEDYLPGISSTLSTNMIVEYEYHVIKRYAERFLKDFNINTEEALSRFLETNQDGIIQFYGENKNLVARVSEDGICLGLKIDDSLLKFKTFITERDLRENQKSWSKYGKMWTLFTEFRKYELKNPRNII